MDTRSGKSTLQEEPGAGAGPEVNVCGKRDPPAPADSNSSDEPCEEGCQDAKKKRKVAGERQSFVTPYVRSTGGVSEDDSGAESDQTTGQYPVRTIRRNLGGKFAAVTEAKPSLSRLEQFCEDHKEMSSLIDDLMRRSNAESAQLRERSELFKAKMEARAALDSKDRSERQAGARNLLSAIEALKTSYGGGTVPSWREFFEGDEHDANIASSVVAMAHAEELLVIVRDNLKDFIYSGKYESLDDMMTSNGVKDWRKTW